jgi:hypothetical protein
MARCFAPGAFLITGALLLALPAHARAASAQKPSAAAQESSKAGAETPAQQTEAARAALREMSAALTAAKTLQFRIRNLIPMQVAGGDWITLVGEASVKREGQNRLSVESGGDLFPFKLLYDGKTVTAFAPDKNMYAQREAPGTIDAMLEQAASKGEAAFVFADLVVSDPYAAMTKGLKSAKVVGTSTLDGVETRHLAVHGQKVDWEIWIATTDHLPRLVTITDIAEARKPTQAVQLSGWAVDQAIPADAFSFNAPADVMQVPFRSPEQRKASARHGPAASGR